MPEYRVKWDIDVTADTPQEAAKIAQDIMQDKGSSATVFDVIDMVTEVEVMLDVADYDVCSLCGKEVCLNPLLPTDPGEGFECNACGREGTRVCEACKEIAPKCPYCQEELT